MGSRYTMDFPSPRGVHVPDTYDPDFDPDDPYPPPSSRRNRYSRSVPQTPRHRDATWISAPAPTPQTPRAPPSPWLAPPAPFSPGAHRPPSPIPPSPAPTVGEHMTVDDLAYEVVDPYQRPQRPGLMKLFWKGLKKLSHGPSFPMPRPSSYASQTIGVPAPRLSDPSEATQYVDPTSSGTRTGSGTENHTTERSTTPYTSPYARPANVGASPAVIPGSLRASPIPVPSMEIPPAITVVSPSISPSPRPNSFRSVRMPSPGPARRTLSVGAPTPDPIGSTQEGSHTLHEPQPARPPLMSAPILVTRSDDDDKIPLPPSGGGMGMQAPVFDRSSSKGSLASTIARFKRFVADIDGLPWVSDSQIADKYVPEMNPRSRMRARVRQGAEPSWYNPRPEVVERPAYWSEWDMWAKQSAAALLDVSGAGRVGWPGVGAGGGGHGPGPAQWGTVYPHGYVPAQSGFVYPSGYPPPGALSDHGHAPVLP
ncbi:hypothetical protein OG21DRAFT_535536 [Imleria badia]|nr:hypothetical protein OG21DRAFT_535536 [Imleria badia]